MRETLIEMAKGAAGVLFGAFFIGVVIGAIVIGIDCMQHVRAWLFD